MILEKLLREGILKFLKYQFYHRLAYLYIDLFKKDNVSYSQNKEDQIIDILTGYKEKGTYIDIGAYHPDKISIPKSSTKEDGEE